MKQLSEVERRRAGYKEGRRRSRGQEKQR